MMRIMTCALAVCFIAMLVAASDLHAWQPPSQGGFVPVEQLGNQEQLPATPLVAAAYGAAWGAILLYVWTIWRRLARVEREIADVSRRIDAGTRR
jgi:CcmD family protein